MNILDIFLPRETKNLQKINKLANRFNKLIEEKEDDAFQYSIIWFELGRIETKEHKDKIEIWQTMCKNIIDIKIKKMLWK